MSYHLIKKRFCVCTNFFPINSAYRWKGKVVNDKEFGLIIKTKDNKFNIIKKEIKNVHSYTTLCIIKIKADGADAKYLKWLNAGIK